MTEPAKTPGASRVMAALFIGLLAVMYVEMVWRPYFDPAEPVVGGEAAVAGQAASAAKAPVVKSVGGGDATTPAVAIIAEGQYPSNEQIAQYEQIEIATSDLNATISLLGGRLTTLRLNDYKEQNDESSLGQNMVEHTEGRPYPLGVISGDVDDSRTIYQISSSSQPLVDNKLTVESETMLELVGALSDGRLVTKQFIFKPEGYLFEVAATLSAPSPKADRLAIEWVWLISRDDLSATMRDPYKAPAWVWFDDQRVSRLTLNEFVDSSEEDLRAKAPGEVRWLTIGTKYFTAGLFSSEARAAVKLLSQDDMYLMRASGGDLSAKFQVFAGPKSYEILESVGYRFDRNIDFGAFELFSAPLLSLLLFFNKLFGNYALAIVMLTIIVKALTYPLNAASFRSMKKMQDLAPEIKKLQETVLDKNLQRQKMMEIYQKKGVNPMGGCLPVLVQMPIFFGLFVALNVAIELRHADFAFWINDLSEPEKLMIGDSFGLPVMVILMVLSMMIQQWLTPSTMDATQKKIMMIMPVVMGFLFAAFPAGLTLYWLTNNLISIAQQRVFYSTKVTNKQGFGVTLAISAVLFLFTMTLVAVG